LGAKSVFLSPLLCKSENGHGDSLKRFNLLIRRVRILRLRKRRKEMKSMMKMMMMW
jgi:hypothetical protein